jgi:hypothetical protein
MFGIKRKKKFGQTSLETLALLLAALIIVGVSAAVYNIFYMRFSPVSVEEAKVKFVQGEDSVAAGASIGTNGTSVLFNSISGWPNTTRIYEGIVGIKNFDTQERNIRLEFDGWSGDTTAIEYIHVKVFDENDQQQGNTVEVGTDGSSTGDMEIQAGTTWRVQLEIKWKADALSTYQVSFALRLIVQGE